MNHRDRIIRTVSHLETALRRHEDTFTGKGGARAYGNSRTGHTDLTDAWAWTLSAMRDAVELLPRKSEYRAVLTADEGIIARADRYLEEVYSR